MRAEAVKTARAQSKRISFRLHSQHTRSETIIEGVTGYLLLCGLLFVNACVTLVGLLPLAVLLGISLPTDVWLLLAIGPAFIAFVAISRLRRKRGNL